PQVTDIVGDTQQVLQVAAALEKNSEHPLAAAILQAAQAQQLEIPTVKDFKALIGQGVQGRINHQLAFVGNEKLVAAYHLNNDFQHQMMQLQEQAKTVVVVGCSQNLIGLIAIQDTPKPSAIQNIDALKNQGLKTVMLTADTERLAQAMGHQVGINQVTA
ncbi:HAD family hydrolase, partial [Lactobacillus sp. XV13L]|nr:HAD family hydrolase [Lactobacillus sp. XV13L]